MRRFKLHTYLPRKIAFLKKPRDIFHIRQHKHKKTNRQKRKETQNKYGHQTVSMEARLLLFCEAATRPTETVLQKLSLALSLQEGSYVDD